MPDPLYLSLWFPGFAESEIMPRMVSVLRQFPFSQQKPGISYLALHPVSWSEPTILERKFSPGLRSEEAALPADFEPTEERLLVKTPIGTCGR